MHRVVKKSLFLPMVLSLSSVLTPAPAGAAAAPVPSTIRRIGVLNSGGSFELQIDASAAVTPQTQVVTGPDRLVVDFPGSIPGPALRALVIHAGAVKGVRAGLFQSSPPVTRVVVDLRSPQAYRVFPSGRSVIVKIMLSDGQPAAALPVVSNATANSPIAAVAPAAVALPVAPPQPHMEVAFHGGKLKISANRASLGEILREVQRLTGAHVSVPPAADQDMVIADIGPAPAREALTALLNGLPYNIILLGSDDDLSKVTAVILTARGSGGGDITSFPASVAQANAEPQPEPPPVQEAQPEPPPQPDPDPPPPPQQ